MSVTKPGLPVADWDPESYHDLFLRMVESTKPRIDSPSNPGTPEERMRMVAAAMQQRFRTDLGKIYIDRLRNEGTYQNEIGQRDEKINELKEKLEGSEKKVEKLREEMRNQNGKLELALQEIERLKSAQVASLSGK